MMERISLFDLQPSAGKKLAVWVGSLFLAMICTLPSPFAMLYIPFFPGGLVLRLIGFDGHNMGSSIFLGYVIYAGHLALFMCRLKLFWIALLWVVLAIFLSLNVVGCHQVLNQPLWQG